MKQRDRGTKERPNDMKYKRKLEFLRQKQAW